MSWDELRKLAKYGATIANHSDSHAHLIRQRPDESIKEWQARRLREIDFAEKRIKKEVGQSVKLLAYPFGEYDMEYGARACEKKGILRLGSNPGQYLAIVIPRFCRAFHLGGSTAISTILR